MDNLEKAVNQIRHLTQNAGKTEDELRQVAQQKIERKEILDSLTFCLSEERKFATELLNKYLEESTLESASEKDTLKHLIDLEVLLERIKKQLNSEYGKTNPSIPIPFIQQVTELTNQIMELKDKLGLIQNKGDKQDSVKIVDNLLGRFHKWANHPDNRSNFDFQCISEGSEVLMSDWTTKNIEDINIGDEIIGIDKFQNKRSSYYYYIKSTVLAKNFSGIKDVCEIETEKGVKLVLTPDHQILSHVRAGTYHSFYEVRDGFDKKIPVLKYIKNISDYYKGVLLGFIESDGWKSKNIDKLHPEWNFSLIYNISQKTEIETLEWILNYLNIKINKTPEKSGFLKGFYGSFSFYIHAEDSRKITEYYKLLENNEDTQMGFLCGFCLGDGSFGQYGSWKIFQKEDSDAILVLDKVFKNLKIDAKYSTYNRMRCYNFKTTFLPFNCPKSNKVKRYLKYFFGLHKLVGRTEHQKIISIKNVGRSRVWDLTTTSKNFIVNGLIVHNCPKCGELFLLRQRLDKITDEVVEHPWFIQGGILMNKEIFEDLKIGKISVDQAARYLNATQDYINWLQINYPLDQDILEEIEEDIDD